MLPRQIRSVFEILVQWMVRVERFGFQNHVQLQQTAAELERQSDAAEWLMLQELIRTLSEQAKKLLIELRSSSDSERSATTVDPILPQGA